MILPTILLSGCQIKKRFAQSEYGVFLGAERNDLKKIKGYKKVVIDAQYFNKEDIEELHSNEQKVYSYLNVGSIENFRSYYSTYEHLTLGDYENWNDEKWVDVSQKQWQDFILNDLSNEILDKGVDGLFIDNIDVFYNYPSIAIYNGIETILKGLKKKNTYVSINGGDTFVKEYYRHNGHAYDIMDAVNQETVFSKINWDDSSFGKNDEEDKRYYQEYVEMVKDKMHRDVYLLEYTKDNALIEQIYNYCGQHVFYYYISSSLELIA